MGSYANLVRSVRDCSTCIIESKASNYIIR